MADGASPDLTDEEREALDQLHSLAQDGNYFDLLQVGLDSDADSVQKAYYALSRKWHPDRFFRRNLGPYAERLEYAFVTITQAYKTLSDPTKRKTYERKVTSEIKKREEARRAKAAEAREQAEKQQRVASARARIDQLRQSEQDKGPFADRKVVEERPTRQPAAANARSGSESPASSTPDPAGAKRSPTTRRPVRPVPRPTRTTARGATQRRHASAVNAVKEQIRAEMERAHRHYLQGKQDFEAGHTLKAAGALRLALEMNPQNDDYRKLLKVVEKDARMVQAAQAAAQAQQAETYHQVKEAIAHYKRAVDEFDSQDATVHYRLGMLVKRFEDDDRSALGYLRDAVKFAPKNVTFLNALGDLYAELGLKLNAKREYQAALKVDPKNEAAKAGLKTV